jgi:hypothetical protein
MKRYITLFTVCLFVIVALSLTSCQQCAKTQNVSYTQYANQCVSYGDNGSCTKEVPMPSTSVTSHCDTWKE